MSDLKLSIVSTLYMSAPFIEEFQRRVSIVARSVVGDSYEIILVNDGSPDDSLTVARRLVEKDAHLRVVDLSRNFGHHRAIMTGLEYAVGKRIFLIDVDLEEAPELLIEMQKVLDSGEADVVYGVQSQRKGGWFERWSGEVFYRLIRRLTGLAIPANVVTARLMSRRYVDALLRHREREIFIAGLWFITGFEQVPLPVSKHSKNSTTYTFTRKMALLVNSVTSFSNVPLVWIFYLGTLISLVSIVWILYLVFGWLFLIKPLSGWTSVMASIWLLGGLVIAFIGVVGIYLSKVFSETKQRPYSIVRQVYGRR